MLRAIFLSVITIRIMSACTCVTTVAETAKSQMNNAALVFRGTAMEIKTLPQHKQMRARARYAITFQVDQYWKGNPPRTVILYDLDPGTDCHGFGYQLGKAYLIYASKEGAKDYRFDDFLWFGWTDVLVPGTPMFQPIACTPGGLISEPLVRDSLRGLGPGKLFHRR